jgi:hypothetical protein
MSEQVEHKVDRVGWHPGPWDGEPDRVEWRAHGFPCLIVRNSSGALCGYVGLPPGHQLHGADYGDAEVSVHGGLTYANKCAGKICHVAKPGEPDDVWWLGFDCQHYGDIAPGHVAFMRSRGYSDSFESSSLGESYKTIGFVTSEVESLAEQLSKYGTGEKE